MSVLVIGASGSMGKRYQAILSSLQIDYVPMDKMHLPYAIDHQAAKSEGIIIATPTETHVDFIKHLSQFKVPILCEKPIVKNLEALTDLMDFVRQEKTNLTMMLQ